jgi:protein kinase C substrate 80K-H
VFDLSSYIPDILLPEYESAVNKVVGWLSTLGIVKGAGGKGGESAEATRAREALSSAESALNRVIKEHKDATEDLADLFDPEAFGKLGEWKKLQGTCLEKDTGE